MITLTRNIHFKNKVKKVIRKAKSYYYRTTFEIDKTIMKSTRILITSISGLNVNKKMYKKSHITIYV